MSEVLLDSNVVLRLLAATDSMHAVATQAVVGALRDGHRIHVGPQIIMESWVVLTRPASANGFGWSLAVARESLEGIIQRFNLVPETPEVFAEWWNLVVAGVRGKRAHDARIAALMRVHEIRFILTFNADDFDDFAAISPVTPGAQIG